MSDVNEQVDLRVKVRELETALAKALKGEEKAVKNWEAAKTELQTKAQEHEAKVAQLQEEWAIDKVVSQHGIDDQEAIEYVKYKASNAKAEDGSRIPFQDFWTSYVETKPAILSKWLDKTEKKVEAKPEQKAQESEAKTEKKVEAKPEQKQFTKPNTNQQTTRPGPTKPSAGAPSVQELMQLSPADRRAHLAAMGLRSEAKAQD